MVIAKFFQMSHNMTFKNDARVSAFFKFVDWRARLSNQRYVAIASLKV